MVLAHCTKCWLLLSVVFIFSSLCNSIKPIDEPKMLSQLHTCPQSTVHHKNPWNSITEALFHFRSANIKRDLRLINEWFSNPEFIVTWTRPLSTQLKMHNALHHNNTDLIPWICFHTLCFKRNQYYVINNHHHQSTCTQIGEWWWKHRWRGACGMLIVSPNNTHRPTPTNQIPNFGFQLIIHLNDHQVNWTGHAVSKRLALQLNELLTMDLQLELLRFCAW